jgi:hypothetical protein
MGFGHHYATMSGAYEDVITTYKKGDLEETIALCNYYIEYYNDMEISYPIPGASEAVSRIQDIRRLATSGVTFRQNLQNKIIEGVAMFILIAIVLAIFSGVIYGLYLGLSYLYEWIISL